MKRLRKIFRLLSHLLLWLLVSVVLWSWIFGFLTDTDRAHKITLFADMYAPEDRALAVALEEELPEGIRMVQVHSFRYAMMDSVSLQSADLYIMTEPQAAEHADWLCPLPEGLDLTAGTLNLGEETVGIRIYSAEEGKGAADAFLPFEEAPGEDWYLCFGNGGYHLKQLENGLDNAAAEVAGRLLKLE